MGNVRFPTKETSVTHRRNERTLSKKLSFLFKGNNKILYVNGFGLPYLNRIS